MSYLLDTNVISEHTRPKPDAAVVKWLRSIPIAEQYMSVLTLGEVRYGIDRLTSGARREGLRRWLDTDVVVLFADRLLPITAGVAERWVRLRLEAGRSVPAVDSLIAATALHHDLRLVARNACDFAHFPGLVVVNPWEM